MVSAQPRGYVETDLVVSQKVGNVPKLTDSKGFVHVAKSFDANLVNPWGIAESATSAFWVADAGAGVSTLYNTAGDPQTLIVSIPSPATPLDQKGTPSGSVFNSVPAAQGAFKLSGVNAVGDPVSLPAVFLFATKDGTILGWNPNVNPPGFDPAKAGKYAIMAVNNSSKAAYTGLALVTDANGVSRLYAANFGGGTVDVFDTSFQQVYSVNAFNDPSLPRGFAPFNVAPITIAGNTRLFVTYANQDLTRLFNQAQGFVNSFRLDGTDPLRFAQRGQLSAPWAVVLMPAEFGELGGTLWIGNFGNGQINAYDPATGHFAGKVRGPNGRALVIDGLWSLKFGNGGNGGAANKLYFTAGPNGEKDGIFGSLEPQP
jgi:uncharacterized protein (TIGR03118 family)